MRDSQADGVTSDWQDLEAFVDLMWQSTVEAAAALEDQRRRAACHTLSCDECGIPSDDGERGWRVYRVELAREAPRLLSLCPVCADLAQTGGAETP